MKQFLSTWKNKWNGFIEKLSDMQFFRKIGITYQVLWNLLLVTFIIGFISIMFAGGAAAGYFASLVYDEPSYSEEDMRMHVGSLTETSEIYLANDVYLGKIRSDVERDLINLDEIADDVKHAIIATEDEHFYEHDGIVPKALLRATMQEISNASVQTGGSTLTQQLIKQQILSNEVSFDRKATEIMLAMRLEQFMSKDEILEAYLNVVPFGRNASGRNVEGIEAAAQGVFGVSAQDLNLPQSAYLAGMPQSPFGYTPFFASAEVKDEDGLRPGFNRLRTVLNRMLEKDFITPEQHSEALEYDLIADFAEDAPDPMSQNPRLTSEILERSTAILVEKEIKDYEGWDQLSTNAKDIERQAIREQVRERIENGGYKISTTIDQELYTAMNEQAGELDHLFLDDPSIDTHKEEIGAVMIDNHTGAILSFVGGREEDLDNQLNHTTRYRSPGSTIKPILPFAGAIEAGVTQPGLVIPDTPETYKSNGDPIGNWDEQHDGNITVRESIKRSRNVPAVRAWWNVPDTLKNHLIDASGLNGMQAVESAAIGGGGATVEQMVSAYTAYGNDGTRPDPYMIEKIETYAGDILYEHEYEEHFFVSPQTNYLVLDMMRDVINGGGNAARVQSMLDFNSDWAAKTGTSQRQWDSWFIAANPDVSFGVWYGYSGPTEISLPSEVSGVGLSARTQTIWANLANAAHSVNPSLMTAEGKRFERPSGITERRVCGLTGGSSNRFCEAENLVTTDLYVNDMLAKIDGLAPFQSEFKRTMDQLLEELSNQEAEERRQQEAEEQTSQQEEAVDEEEETEQQEETTPSDEADNSTDDEDAGDEVETEDTEADSDAESEEE